MKKRWLFLLLFPLIGRAEDYKIYIHVKNLPEKSQPVLMKIFNGDLYLVDSLPILEEGTLTFNVPEATHAGMLRAILGKSTYARFTDGPATSIDFLFNKENIELALDFDNPAFTLEVIQSEENRILREFSRRDYQFFKKLGTLEQVLLEYPEKDEFYKMALKYYDRFQHQREEMLDSIYQTHRERLAGKIIRTQRMPFASGDTPPQIKDSLLKAHFLDKIEFTDTSLLYTSVYTDKLFQYINFFINRNKSPRENEASIIQALELIRPKIEADPHIRNHLLRFLINGFESMKMEEVLAYLSNSYLQQCDGSMDLLKQRLEGYEKMAIGKKVPDLLAVDLSGTPVSLYASIHPYTLLIFWHTQCSICQKLMIQLPFLIQEDFFKKYNVSILSVSIDDKKEDWVKFSEEHRLEWTNTFVEGGFESQVASDFHLFATPTLFLLDSENTILAKPITIEELRKAIEQLDE